MGADHARSTLSRGQQALWDSEAWSHPMLRGTATHNAVARALEGCSSYNPSNGPDFFFGDHYIELTTEGQYASHVTRYGGKLAGSQVGQFNGFPVYTVTYGAMP